jgi:soluble lytic murein transglycosylase
VSRRSAEIALAVAVTALSAVACGDKTPPPRTTPTVDAASEANDGSAAASDAGDGGAAPPLAWPDAIRRARFAEAAEGLARLPEGEQNKPEVRLARARVALAVGKPADAALALDKLDEELPLLRDLIARTRAQAMVEVGPFDKAAEYFGSRRDAASLILAAEAWEKAGDTTKARVLWDRAVAGERRSRVLEEKARHRRLQITRLKDGDAAAGVDARWLATNALDEKAFSEAAELLEKLSPPRLLTAEELLARSRILADALRTEEALRAIERATTRKDLPAGDVCRARAEALWKARTRYPEAAVAYRACAALGGAHAAEDLFLSARSFARAERDGDAIPAFQSVIAKHPRTPWADQSEFFLARNHALAGRWKDAAVAFDEYVRHWPAGKEKREAERYRALSHLISRNDKRARKLLEDLAGGAEDPTTAARWTNLAALAALRDGDKLHALARWAEVARSRPLSYPALVARARLVDNGGSVPPAIEPPESGNTDLGAIELPAPADMLHRIGFEAEAEEALREREAAVVTKDPARRTETLCAAYASLDRAKRRYQLALQIPAQAVATAPGGKNRVAWDCLFPRPYDGIVRAAASRTRIAPDLVWSVMRQESAFDPEVVSPARAVGLMQILPETARATATAAGVPHEDAQLTSPPQSILLGSLYLRELLDKFGDSPTLSVAAYNAGPEAVQRWLNHFKVDSLDVFVEAIPFIETRGYVARVLGNLARYGYLDRGDAGIPAIALPLKRE